MSADNQTGSLIYTPTYYYIGHFSKFISPGAQRVSTTTNFSELLATSFINQDGSIASVVMNQSEQEMPVNFIVDEQEIKLVIPARSIQTLVY